MLDPGLGKTSITLKSFDILRKTKVVERMLVIAPLRVCHQVWPAEVAGWNDFKHLKVAVLHGNAKEKLLYSDADIFVINPEGLDWLIGQHTKAELRSLFGGQVLTIDELTRFKKSTGKRFKLLRRILDLFAYRWGLTGTPVPNGLLDLFGQVYVIDGGRSFGRYITHYKRQYFRPLDPNGWKWALQPGADELIYERLSPLAIRMAAKDYLELPELVNIKHFIDLPKNVRTLYDELENDLISKFQDGLVVAGNAAAASTKCRQICNGALYVEDDIASLVGGKRRTVMQLHDLKLDAVEELVDELQGGQLLLAYEFNHDLAAIKRRWPDIPYIGSGVSTKRCIEIENEWNAGGIPLLPAHPASAGHGLNLQKSNAFHVGWYGAIWDAELFWQFIARILRQGNTSKRVFNHHFLARNTIEELVFYDKIRKEKGQEKLFAGLQELAKARKG